MVRAALVVLVDHREFIRGCFSSGLKRFSRHFEVVDVADVEKSLEMDLLARAAAVVVGSSPPIASSVWLRSQIAWLLAHRPDARIVVITEPGEARAAEDLVARLRLSGYIPTSSTMEVAAAALHLVVAGGIYLPRIGDENEPAAEGANAPPNSTSMQKLTGRESAVLDLLQRGMANKMIAHGLGMSQSTVKAHVHNIIAKLNVSNRTEAAVAVRRNGPLLSIATGGGTPIEPVDDALPAPADTAPAFQFSLTPAQRTR
jgi:DNA-binding NarL/FixJ family response regulator